MLMRRLSKSASFVRIASSLLVICAIAISAMAVPVTTRTKMNEAVPEIDADPNADPVSIVVLAPWTPDRDDLVHHMLALVREMERATGALTVSVISDTDEWLEFEGIDAVDACVLINGSVSPLDTDEARSRLLQAVEDGAGLVLLHSAIEQTAHWPELADLARARYAGITPPERVRMFVEGWDHQCNLSFDEPAREMKMPVLLPDDSFSRGEARVLFSALVSRQGGTVTRVPLTWIAAHESSRVFCSTLGTDEEHYVDPGFVAQWLAGIRFAAGAIDVDARPNGTLPGLISLSEALDEVRTLDSPAHRHATSAVAELMYQRARQGDAEASEVEDLLLELLESDDVTVEARRFACRQLVRFGSARASRTLLPLLDHPDLARAAYRAVEALPNETKRVPAGVEEDEAATTPVNQQLIDLAMNEEASTDARAAAIRLLGRRDAKQYDEKIRETFFDHENPALRHAAYEMIGRTQATTYEFAEEMIGRYLKTEEDAEKEALLRALHLMYTPGAGQTAYGSMFTTVAHKDGSLDKHEIIRTCEAAQRIGGYRGSQTVIMFGREDDPEVWKAMEDSLMNWPDALGHKSLMIMVETGKEMGQDRQALLERFVEMIDNMDGFPELYRATALVQAFDLSERRETDLKIARAAAYIDDVNAIDVAVRALERHPDDPAITRAASRAIVAVSDRIGWSNRDKAVPALRKVIERLAESDHLADLRDHAAKTLATIEGDGG